jgi:TrmH family RNA methyltransferase
MGAALPLLSVVLVRTRNPLNIGAAARAMQNFGASDLRVVAPYEASFREARSAVGAGAVLEAAREFANVAEAVADCRLVVGTTAARRRELHQPVIELQHAGERMRGALAEGRVALLFGSEKHGLTREDLDRCHWLLHVPAEPEQPSLNLGQAVAVCLWELARDAAAEPPPPPPEPGAPVGELERLGGLLMEVLQAGGYLHSGNEAGTRSEVRRLLLRYSVTEADTYLLMGMARRVLWKLRGSLR